MRERVEDYSAVLATPNPTKEPRNMGSSVSREAVRQSPAQLAQEPPRITRSPSPSAGSSVPAAG
ncbi:MAG: hypothetical protein Fur0037_27410 [Planctomycetota bacterium]